MSKVNFVSEFNLFMRYARDHMLPMRERMLWIALFYIANDRATYNEQTQEYDWPDGFIQVSNGELNLYCCLDKRGIETLRNGLKQRGLIDFQPGQKNKRNPAYKLNYFSADVGDKKASNHESNCVSNDAPNHVPSITPNHAPNNAPTDAENAACFGTEMHPTMSPYPKYKYANHSQVGYSSNENAGQRYTPGRNGAGNPSADDGFGFVDLGGSVACEGFVQLHEDGGGM